MPMEQTSLLCIEHPKISTQEKRGKKARSCVHDLNVVSIFDDLEAAFRFSDFTSQNSSRSLSIPCSVPLDA